MSLADRHPYWADVDDLLKLFPSYKNRQAIYLSIHRGNFPVPTFRVGGRRYADKHVLKEFFLEKRREAIRLQAEAEK